MPKNACAKLTATTPIPSSVMDYNLGDGRGYRWAERMVHAKTCAEVEEIATGDPERFKEELERELDQQHRKMSAQGNTPTIAAGFAHKQSVVSVVGEDAERRNQTLCSWSTLEFMRRWNAVSEVLQAPSLPGPCFSNASAIE